MHEISGNLVIQSCEGKLEMKNLKKINSTLSITYSDLEIIDILQLDNVGKYTFGKRSWINNKR